MNTKMILSVLGGAVVVGGGIWFLTTQKALAPSSNQADQMASKDTGANTASSGSGTFASLMTRGGNFQCTVSMKDPRTPSDGVVYFADKNIRGDFTSSAAGQKIASSMIQTGGFVYTWTNLYPQGFKMPVPNSTDTGTTGDAGFNNTTAVTYDCKPWSPDASKFVPPTNITFVSSLGE